jgi:hypothetical protein
VATFDYAGIRDEAQAILLEFGFQMQLTRYVDTADAVAGTVQRAPSQQQELTGVILPASQGTLEAFDVRFMSDVMDSVDVRFCILSASGATFQPEPKDVATFWEPGDWQVMGCTPLNVAGVPLIYSVGLKRP